MQAILRTTYGSSDILKFMETDKPVPKDNQILIKVSAASVNPLDWHVLRGDPFLIRLMGFGILKPKHKIIGADMSGTVEAVGKDVTQFKTGDEVFGSGMGGFAEYACIPESRAVIKPASMSFEQAAAVPIAGVTALQALRDHGKLQSRQHLLINGASGGVGTFAVQIAKAMGAEVTGVCSGKNLELVKSIGADHLIDYTKDDFWLSGTEYDLILDNAAFNPISKSLSALRKGGIYIGIGGSSDTLSIFLSMIFNPLIAKMKGRKVASFIADINQTELSFIKELMENGKIEPVIGRSYTLRETPEAIKYVETGHARGKVVITLD
ncbi:MAG: NAD(P)-dependent alcohol dehydrogenase [Calditrichaeota bacterium]|nr:MAG: NAD(P)-dependent alcohol dehydrogenase [Calditrichota bacterium]